MKIGIIGATQNKTKYGYKVLKNLIKRNIGEVYPINPNYKEIEGKKCYPSIYDIPYKLDLLVFILPPERGLKILNSAVEKDIKNVWFQPGAESREIEEVCIENKLNYSIGRCIMVISDEEVRDFIK